jgi:hypothetical protein
MSRNVKNTPAAKPKATDSKKPYCKVCFDAGKPESEYTSHWVRSLPDRSGKTTVTCPTLLDTECRYCFNFGHTAKFCPAIKQQEKERVKADRKAKAVEVEKTKPKVQEKKSGSVFAALVDSDSEEEKPEKVSNNIKPIDNFPVLCRPAEVAAAKPAELKTGWAVIAAKPAEAPRQQPILLSNFIKLEKTTQKKAVESKPAPWAAKTPVITKSWADYSDSEEEYEDIDPYQPYAFSVAAEEDDEDW